MPVRGLGSGMTREQAYSGNEIGMRTTHPNLRTGTLWERNWHAYNDTISFQSMPVRGLGSGMTREQAYSGNEIGMQINLADTT